MSEAVMNEKTVVVEEQKELLSAILEGYTETKRANVKDELSEFINAITGGSIAPSDSALKTIDSAIAKLDELISLQLNEVMHSEKFQQVESTWRGLDYLIRQTNLNSSLKIKVFNVSKKDLLKDLQNASEFDQSNMFKKIYEEQFGSAGGAPFGALMGDYYFDVTDNADMTIVENMSGIAAASHAPFLTAASHKSFGFNSFEQLDQPRDLGKIFDPSLNPETARWNAFREWDDARYVGMCMPSILLRLPYGENNPSAHFNFEEITNGDDHGKYLWGNAAWALASRITNAFSQYGWCVNITGREGGGTVEGLPLHTFKTDSGEVASKCPTEVAITDRRDNELDTLGFIPLCHYKDTNFAVFFKTHSAQKPKQYADPDANANAELSVHLTYLMAVSRFAHYMKVILRDKLGSFQEAVDIESYLNKWFSQYTLADPSSAGMQLKAEKPLREFKVAVVPVDGRPGSYTVDLHLRPHYQLQDISMGLHLVSNVSKS